MLVENFWKKVQKTSGCWLWTGATMSQGRYGAFKWDRETIGAHVASFRIHNGDIPRGQAVLHECDTGLCVRPDHLFSGTQLENVRNMIFKCRDRRTISKFTTDELLAEIKRRNKAEIIKRMEANPE